MIPTALPCSHVSANLREMNRVPLEQLSHETFAGLVKTNFCVRLNAQDSVGLELTEVTPPSAAPAGPAGNHRHENFSLLFLGPADPVLPQKIYPFESAQLGRFELFIVPVGRDQNGTRYQAIFSRLVPSG